ncbi:restriction endonuclease subunit S [Aeromonas jandaei]|uniref:restriction endonuclease subunit S n=1 Tax=Aeromonas jandaei TaxID=650 RepID=UPI0019200AC3|nr:restriction endonuclease subunit S [Aeromonas jandaei]MBL0600250.1 restriction endonuclease subunit S [Aeromonas jandaei]HDX8593121.1 restriction endonuclease subunit S [Aeromonas dhakensis]
MSQLPEGWNKIKLDCLLDFVIGGDWGKEPDFHHTDFENVLCIRGTEFRHWSKEKGKTAVSRKVKSSSLAKRRLELGDIIIEISGGGPEQPVGRTVIIDEKAISIANGVPLICTNFTRLARPSKEIDSAFLNYFLTFFYNSGEITKYQSGSNNLRNLQFQDYIQIGVPLAPLAEQTRIVEKLDEVLAQVDTIKACLDGIPAFLKRFRQSVLTAAVSGILTEEWRDDFSLSESVQERYIKFRDKVISNASSATQKEKLIKAHQKDEKSEFPLTIPNAWELKNLNKIAFGFSYGSSSKSQAVGSVPVLRMGNIQNGKLDWNDLVYTSDSTEIEKYRLSKGDVLFNRTNSPELVGKTAIYRGEKEAIYAGYLIKVQGSELLYSEFLNIALNSLHAKNYCLSVKTDGVSQSNINAQKLGDFPCPLPSIEEQKEIVRLVDQYFTFADSIEAQVKNAKTRVDNLTKAILAKAFRGELTADWRVANPDLISGDNSAAALLARIQAERATASGKKGKRGPSKSRATA